MGDQNYYPDQYNYGFSDHPTNQGYKPAMSNPFVTEPTPGSCSADNRQSLTQDRGRDLEPYSRTNLAQYSATLTSQSGKNLGYRRERQDDSDRSSSNYDPPPPSYADSQQDRFISRSRAMRGYEVISPTWNEVPKERRGKEGWYPQKTSGSNFSNVSSNTEPSQTSSRWSDKNYSASQNYKSESQIRINPCGNNTSHDAYEELYKPKYREDNYDESQTNNQFQSLPSREPHSFGNSHFSGLITHGNSMGRDYNILLPQYKGNGKYSTIQSGNSGSQPNESQTNNQFQSLPSREPHSFGNSPFSGLITHGNSMGRDYNILLPIQSGNSGSQPNEFEQSNFQRGLNRRGQGCGQGRGGFSVKNNARNFRPNLDHQKKQLSLTGSVEKDDDHDDGNNGDDDDGDDDDGDDEGESGKELVEKVDVFYPDPTLVEEYKDFPPPPQRMGELFKDLVIYFFFKVNSTVEKSQLRVICGSFLKSSGYTNVDIKDGYDAGKPSRRLCTIRYRRMMLVRGVGEGNNIKEARELAAVELINNLAMSCYILQAKPEYFNTGQAIDAMRQKREDPGVFRFVTRAEAPSFESACNYVNSFFKEDSDVELIFEPEKPDPHKLKSWANKEGYGCRLMKQKYVGISKRRTPQYWRDKILASGKMSNEKFILIPPLGIGNLFWADLRFIPKLKRSRVVYGPRLENKYGPPGVGPKIILGLPPSLKRKEMKRKKFMAKLATANFLAKKAKI